MKNKYHRLSVRFYFVSSLLLGLAFAKIAAAVSFSAIDASPCATSGGFDSGGFCSDIGIDYSQLTGHLVTSVHFDTGSRTASTRRPHHGVRRPLFATIVKSSRHQAPGTGGCTQQWPVGTVLPATAHWDNRKDRSERYHYNRRDSAFGETAVLTGLFMIAGVYRVGSDPGERSDAGTLAVMSGA